MKPMTMVLAAVMSFNGSFIATLSEDQANQQAIQQVIKLKTDLSTLEFERDSLKSDITETSLRIQALEDIASPDLAATYREHKSEVLFGTGLAGIAIAGLFRVAPQDEFLIRGGKGPGFLQKTIPMPAMALAFAALGTLALTDSDQQEKFLNFKTIYKGMSDEHQTTEFFRCIEVVTTMGNKLSVLEQKISTLEYQIAQKE